MCFYYAITKKSANQLIKNKVVSEKQLSLFEDKYLTQGFEHELLPIITSDKPNEIQFFKWGLIPAWTKDIDKAQEIQNYTLNAKSETVFTKPSFKDSIEKRRCLVLCSGFYEWHTKKQGKKKVKYPYFISLKDDELFVFAGIWDAWTDIDTGEIHNTFSLLTTEANELMQKIHNEKKRMPLILAPEDAKKWLSPNSTKNEIKALFKPFESGKMKAHTISKLITSKDKNVNVPDVQAYYHYPELIDEIENKLLF